MPTKIPRAAYAAMFGPTTGDRLRLADTELIIEIESDRTIYGEEVKFGGGKVIRDGMGQGQSTRAGGAVDMLCPIKPARLSDSFLPVADPAVLPKSWRAARGHAHLSPYGRWGLALTIWSRLHGLPSRPG